MKNKLGFLGLLGFMGVLGIVTDNRWFLAFFAYFVFFRYFFVVPDELFRQNVQRAATPAFFTAVGIQVLTMAVFALTNEPRYFVTGMSLCFSLSVMLFIVCLVIAEFREMRGR